MELKIKLNEVELQVKKYEYNGETVIFLHCGTGNLAQWNGVIPYFLNKYNIITIDMRGHGRSEKIKSGYTIDNMGKDIIGVMNELKIDKAHIIGSSLGGEIAASLASNYKERILSIVVEGAPQNYFGNNGVLDIPESEIENKKEELRNQRAERAINEFICIDDKLNYEKLKFINDGMDKWNKLIEDYIMYDITKNDEGKYVSSCPAWVIDEYIEDYWNTKFEKYYGKISCPVLFLPSEEEWNNIFAKRSIENIQKLLKVSKVKNIKNAIHAYVMFYNPKEFSEAILEFHKEIRQ